MSDNKKSAGLVLAAAPSAHDWPPSSLLNPPAHFEWSPILMTDLHGVIVDWESNFQKFAHRHFGLTFNTTTRKFYDIGRDPSQHITPDQFNELFIEFVRLPDGYGALQPNLVVIRQLEEIAKAGIKIVVATYTPGATDIRPDFGIMGFHHGVAQAATKKLIMRVLGHLISEQDIIFCSPSEKKHMMFTMHCPLLIEDHPVTAVDVATSAHAAILVPRSYNASLVCQNVLRLENDNQLADAVLTVFGAILDAGKLASV